MEQNNIDKWNERHFQICLALIARPVVNVYGTAPVLNFNDIINKADRMVSLLKEREQKFSTTDAISGQKLQNKK